MNIFDFLSTQLPVGADLIFSESDRKGFAFKITIKSRFSNFQVFLNFKSDVYDDTKLKEALTYLCLKYNREVPL